MTQATTTIETLIDRYLTIWNETDPAARRALIAQTWAPGATYRDPLLAGDGHDGIDAMTAGFQAAYPNHTFQYDGEHDAAARQFGWKLVNPSGDVVLTGEDTYHLSGGGLFQAIVGRFTSPVPGQE